MHPARADGAGKPERGFVLVGVVMFVLALTILGLSLFALSSYEGQFVDRSTSSVQALDAAMSGLEHAKFVLARTQLLQNVGGMLYPTGVVYARARRTDNADTVGALSSVPANVPIAIRVLTNVGGERHMLEAHVLPLQIPHLYKRLMSVTDSMYAQSDASIIGGFPNGLACGHYVFNGEIWEGGKAGQAWKSCAQGDPSLWNSNASIPTPDVQAFITQHTDLSTQSWEAPSGNPVNMQINLVSLATIPRVTYFKTVNSDPTNQASLFLPKHNSVNPGTLTIDVSGYVVWMLPNGFHCDRNVVVNGLTGNDCLVIVAGISTDPDIPTVPSGVNYGPLGITFSAAIESQSVPVILVTDGWVFDEHWFLSDIDPFSPKTGVNYLSVFARAASYWGPAIGTMELDHPPGDPRDAPGGLIDQLSDQRALPNVSSSGITFKPVAGTWRELDPDNPPPN